MAETIVVLGLGALLASAAVSGYSALRERQLNGKVGADLLALSSALEDYSAAHGHYPLPQPGGLQNVLCFSSPGVLSHDCSKAVILQSRLDAELLSSAAPLPLDPRTGTPYAYAVSADGRSFELAGLGFRRGEPYALMRRSPGDPLFPAMMRAYNGPELLAENDLFLPYPASAGFEAWVRSASDGVLAQRSGQESQEFQEPLRARDRLMVPAKGRATLYFSDGSFSALGSDAGPTQLEFGAESTENRIRLKLDAGRIWSKVVRLAQASSFRIETAGAVAGVRGTEFGIDAESKAILVSAGEVWVGEDLDSNDVSAGHSAILDSQGPLQIQPFDLVPEWAAGLAKLDGFGLENVTPYPLGFIGFSQQPYSVFFSFNGAQTEDSVAFDGVQVFGGAQSEGFRIMKPGALEQPLLELTAAKITYDPQRKAYAFDLDYQKKEGNPLWHSDEESLAWRHQPLLIRAYRNLPQGRSYSQLSWPPVGLLEPEALAQDGQEVAFPLAQLYPELTLPQPSSAPPLDALAAELACQVGGGYWFQQACWVLGAPAQSCTQACQSFGAQNSLPGLACDEGQWNDTPNCQICEGLIGEDSLCSESDQLYSPFSPMGTNLCRFDQAPAQCGEEAPFNIARICKCIF